MPGDLREAGVVLPFGFERLSSLQEIAECLAEIKHHSPDAKRAVVKLNEGFSGEGNALFYYEDLSATDSIRELSRQILDRLPTKLKFEAPLEHWDSFSEKYTEMGGVVEEFIEGENKQSPSAQCRVNAIGEPQVISTHDQVLGGPSGQVFSVALSAEDAYRMPIQELWWTCRPSACRKALSVVLASITSRCPTATVAGTTTRPRSIYAKEEPPIRSSR